MRLLGVLGLSLLVVAGLTEKSMADVNCEQLPDCAALGFSTEDDENCTDDGYLYCPFDTSYKKCVKHLFYACPDGYSADITDVKQCGSSGWQGWTLEIAKVEANDGSEVSCGKCTKKECEGNPEKTSVADCGSTGSSGWNYTFCYYGDELRGTCEPWTCSDRGYSSSSIGCEIWATASVYAGNSLTTCYKCSNCIGQSAITACSTTSNGAKCKWACNEYLERPSGYPYGSCPSYRGNWKCCSYSASASKPTGYGSSDVRQCY